MTEHQPTMSYFSHAKGERVFLCGCGEEFPILKYGEHLNEVDPIG